MNHLRKVFALPICSLDFSLKNSTTTPFSISWFSTDCTQTILTHTWGPDKQISFYHVPVKWMITDHKQHLKTFMINLPEVCWPLSCCTILPHFNISSVLNDATHGKLKFAENIHKPSSTTSPTKTFAIPAMAITTLGGMEVPPVTLCMSWKTKKQKLFL